MQTETDYREYWKMVPGWCAFAASYEHAIKHVPTGGKIVEVGSYRGKSACLMASLIRSSGKAIEFFCIDPWEGGGPDLVGTPFEMKGDALYQDFLKNTERFREFIKPMRMSSVDASKLFADHGIDYLMLDGDHSYEAVKADLDAWLPKMRPGSIIAGDDYLWPGVNRAFGERFGTRVHGVIKKEHPNYRNSVAYCWVQL